METAFEQSPSRGLVASRFSSQRCAAADAGFTLIEVIVSFTVLMVAMVSVAHLLTVGVGLHQLSRNTEVATELAQRKFEELMKLNFDTAAAVQITPVGSDSLNTDVANYFDVPGARLFTRRWLVQAGPVARTRRVTVRMVPIVTNRLVSRPVEITSIIRQW